MDDWQRLIQEMDLDTMVTFLPFRPDVRRLMRSADLVVVPSTSEGFGLTAIEAMAEQTAVIAAEVGGLAEIIQSGHDGLLFPGGDSAALAGAIKRLLANPAERERLAAEGRCTVEARYSTGRMVDEIEKELLKLLPRP